jgi:hypothetical protein
MIFYPDNYADLCCRYQERIIFKTEKIWKMTEKQQRR